MASLCLTSSSSTNALALHNSNKMMKKQNQQYICAQTSRHLVQRKLSSISPRLLSSSLISFNPLRVSVADAMMLQKRKRGFGAVCYGGVGVGPITAHSLQWISIISSAILMFAKGTAIHKSFLAPLLALQAPSTVISWIKSDYGIWAAFLALLVRLIFFIPGELELPFLALLLVIVAPFHVMNLRGTQEGAIIGLVIAAYLAFQHFSRAGNLQKAFEQGSIVATIAIICLIIISCLFLI